MTANLAKKPIRQNQNIFSVKIIHFCLSLVSEARNREVQQAKPEPPETGNGLTHWLTCGLMHTLGRNRQHELSNERKTCPAIQHRLTQARAVAN
jgi:hypothetical protein